MEATPDQKLITIVTSKVRQTIKRHNRMQTSYGVIEKLDSIVHALIEKAIINAEKDGRKTVMERDIQNG